MVSAASRVDVVLCSDQTATGTNALLMPRDTPLVLSFGERSFDRHREAAMTLGASWEAVQASGIATDIDSPEDLLLLSAEAAGLGGSTVAWCQDI